MLTWWDRCHHHEVFFYLLTCIDHFTWWPEAIPITYTTTETVILAFLNGWVGWVSRYNVPSTTVTNCGCQFESHLWTNLLSFLKCKQVCTTAYHPQSNGMVEHFHRQLKCALKAQTNTDLWMEALPLVLLRIRTALKEDISSTAAEWCMAQLSAYLENTSPLPQLQLPHTTKSSYATYPFVTTTVTSQNA